jgi:uncharacterized protein YjiS (DUF1127 family)
MSEFEQIQQAFRRRNLEPAAWDRCRDEIVRSARHARARTVRALLARSLSAMCNSAETVRDLAFVLATRAAAAAARWSDAYMTWNSNRRAVRELHALGDRTLKDFGIHRSEIESVVYSRASGRQTEGRAAAKVRRKPHSQNTNGTRSSSDRSAGKQAA